MLWECGKLTASRCLDLLAEQDAPLCSYIGSYQRICMKQKLIFDCPTSLVHFIKSTKRRSTH